MTATLILKNRLPNKSNSSFPFHCRLDTNLGGGGVQKSITRREALITLALSIFSTKKENKLVPLELLISLLLNIFTNLLFSQIFGWLHAYMQKTCDVAEKAILAKKNLRKKCVNRDKM